MTTTVDRPPAGVKPGDADALTYAQAFDTIAELIAHGAPHPVGFNVQGYGVDPRLDVGHPILTLKFDNHESIAAWASLLGITAKAETSVHHTSDHHEYEIRKVHSKWFGWSLWLDSWMYRAEPQTFEEDCGTCRQARLDNPAPQRCIWLGGCQNPRNPGRSDGLCDDHFPVEPARDHAAQIRRELVEALASGPSTLVTYRIDAIYSALRDGVIVEVGEAAVGGHMRYALAASAVDLQASPECPGCGVLNGAHQPSCYAVAPGESDGPLVERVYTFGYGHTEPSTGAQLAEKYALIRAVSAERCRQLMILRYGDRWAFEYVAIEDAGWSGGSPDLHVTITDGEPDATVVYAPPPAQAGQDDAARAAELAEVLAHRHQTVPVVEVLTDDPDLVDDSRGGAGIARMTEATS